MHAQYVPRKHAEQVAGVCTAVASAAGHAMPIIWKRNTKKSERVLAKNEG